MTGSELRALRIRAGMKGVDLAARLGISPEHLSRMEHDKKPIKPVMELAVYALGSQDRPAPDGWVLVPREATPEMLSAWYNAKFMDCGGDAEAYRAMLAASPSALSGEGAE